MTTADRTACITLDLENNWGFESANLKYLVLEHLDEYIELIQSLDVPVSVFVVGEFLEERADVVHRLDAELDIEFHLHSYSHDMNGQADVEEEVRKGVAAFEDALGGTPRGYRAPRFVVDDDDLATLSAAGFEFDSSICPSYRPGVYNNLDKPTTPFVPDAAPGLLEVPVSVHPRLRIPLSQSYLRLFRGPYLSLLRHTSLPEPLVFDSHLHDFYRTRAHDALDGTRRFLFSHNIDNSVDLFRAFVDSLERRNYRFEKIGTVVDRIVRGRQGCEP